MNNFHIRYLQERGSNTEPKRRPDERKRFARNQMYRAIAQAQKDICVNYNKEVNNGS